MDNNFADFLPHQLANAPSLQGRLVIGLVSDGALGMSCGQALEAVGHVVGFIPDDATAENYTHVHHCFPQAREVELEHMIALSDMLIVALSADITETTVAILQEKIHTDMIMVIIVQGNDPLIDISTYTQSCRIIVLCPLSSFTSPISDTYSAMVGSYWAVLARNEIDYVIGQSLVAEMGAIPLVVDGEALTRIKEHFSTLIDQVQQLCYSSLKGMHHICEQLEHSHISTALAHAGLLYVDNSMVDGETSGGHSMTMQTAKAIMLPFMENAVAEAITALLQ